MQTARPRRGRPHGSFQEKIPKQVNYSRRISRRNMVMGLNFIFEEKTRIRRNRKNDEATGRKSGRSDRRKQWHRFGNGKAFSGRRRQSSHFWSKQENPG